MHSEFRAAEHRPLDDSDAHLVMRAAALMLLTTSVRPWESATHARFDDVVKLPYVITKIYRLLFDSSALRIGQPTQPLAMISWGLGESIPSARTSTPPARQATWLIACSIWTEAIRVTEDVRDAGRFEQEAAVGRDDEKCTHGVIGFKDLITPILGCCQGFPPAAASAWLNQKSSGLPPVSG